MWNRIHTLWLSRNDDRHGRTSKAKTQASHQQAQRTIRSLYLLKDLVLSEDRDRSILGGMDVNEIAE
jgi:hypothetical protein